MTLEEADDEGHISEVFGWAVFEPGALNNSAPTDLYLAPTTVSEDAASGTSLSVVLVEDELNDHRTFTMTDSLGGAFAIHSETGEISVANRSLLDYESNGSAVLTIEVTDSLANSYTESFTITILDANDAPEPMDDFGAAIEAAGIGNNVGGANAIGNVLANDTDQDQGDTKAVSGVAAGFLSSASGAVGQAVVGSFGTVTIDAEGNYVYTVDNTNPAVEGLRTYEETLLDVFTYTIVDAGGLTGSAQLSITIHGANDDPLDITLDPLAPVENLISLRMQTDCGGDENALTPPRYRIYTDGVVAAEGIADWPDGTWETVNLMVSGSTPESVWLEFYNDSNSSDDNDRNLRVDYIDVNGQRFEAESPSTVYRYSTGELHAGQELMPFNGRLEFTTSGAPAAADIYDGVLPENMTWASAGTLATVDKDISDTFTYTVSDIRFEVISGQLRLKSGQMLNHETEPVIELTVTSRDAAGSIISEFFRLQVSNTAENPTDIALSNFLIAENSEAGTSVGALTVTDLDLLDHFSFILSDDAGGRFTVDEDGVVRVASGAILDYETQDQYSISAEVSDSSGNLVSRMFVIQLSDANEAPTVNLGLESQTVNEDSLLEYVFDANAFADQDLAAGDELDFDATLADGSALPDWLVFTKATRKFSGTPRNANVGRITVKVTARDKAGEEVSDTFDIDVLNVNDDPFANQSIPDQIANEDQAFTFTISGETFGDDDILHGDILSYSASLADGSPLPNWLSFDHATKTFSGTPENGDVGSIALKVTATDNAGSTAEAVFQLSVQNTNDAPVAQTGSSLASEDGGAVTGLLTATDDDLVHGDVLTYSLISDTLEGSVVVNANGSYAFDPAADFQDLAAGETRDVTFVFEVEDNHGATSQETVTITVSGTNDGLFPRKTLLAQPKTEV